MKEKKPKNQKNIKTKEVRNMETKKDQKTNQIEWVYIKTPEGIKKIEKTKINPKKGDKNQIKNQIVEYLDQEPGLTQGDLAKKLNKTGASINPLLRELIKEGKIGRMGYPFKYFKIVPGPE